MPNEYGQMIESDFRAPYEGWIRIIRERMDDGECEIVADFRLQSLAKFFLIEVSATEEFIYTTWESNGKEML